MRQYLIAITFSLFISHGAFAQKFISDKNHISFYSKAPMEDIEAHTYKAKSVFDAGTGEIVFAVPIKTFQFEKSLMQEHFNEKYLESHKYPKARFKGKMLGFESGPGKQVNRTENVFGLTFAPFLLSVQGRHAPQIAAFSVMREIDRKVRCQLSLHEELYLHEAFQLAIWKRTSQK